MWYTITSDREVKDHDAGIQGHKTSSDAGIGGLDPRGSRQPADGYVNMSAGFVARGNKQYYIESKEEIKCQLSNLQQKILSRK